MTGDREAETRSLALGGEEGRREALHLLGGDPRPRVADAHLDRGTGPAVGADQTMLQQHARGEGELAALLLHRLHRVAREVQEDLLQPGGVGEQVGQGGIVETLDLDLLVAALELEQVEEHVEGLVDVHLLQLEGLAAREDHQLIDEPGDAVHLGHDQLRGLFRALVRRGEPEQLGRAADAPERVLHLVGDPGGDVSVGLLTIALADLLPKRAGGAPVAQGDRDRAPCVPVLDERGDGHLHRDRGLAAAREVELVVDLRPIEAADARDDRAEGMIFAHDVREPSAPHPLVAGAEQPHRLRVAEHDVIRGVQKDHALEQCVEDALEIGTHGGCLFFGQKGRAQSSRGPRSRKVEKRHSLASAPQARP